MAANGNLIFQDTNKATFVGANSNVVIDTVHASFGVGVDVNGPTSNLHVVGNCFVSTDFTASTLSGNGSGLTALNAANVTTGTLDRNTTGSAATLTTPRTIGGVNFDGSADIVPTTFGAATFDTDTLVVDSVNNRVGVGTTSPSSQLELYGAGKDLTFKYDTGITRRSAATRDEYYSGLENSIKRVGDRNIFDGSPFTPDTTHEILFGFSDTYTQYSGLDQYYPSYNEMRFKLWSPSSSTVGSLTDVMTLRGDGNVGIGTTTPGEKLHVDGIIKAQAVNCSGGGPVITCTANNPGDMISKRYGSADRYGMGQYANGVTRLFTATAFSSAKIALSGATDDVTGSAAAFTDYLTVVASSGNVGIGTTSPLGRLHVQTEARSGTEGSGNGIYVTSGCAEYSNGSEFRHSNQSQGVGIGYAGIYATGSNPNQDLHIVSRGTGTTEIKNYRVYSDDRVKMNEEYITNATETLLKLKPQIYDKHEEIGVLSDTPLREAGLIAQDIYYDTPELRYLVSTRNKGIDAEPVNIPQEKPFVDDDPANDPDYSSWGTAPASVAYIQLIPYLIKSNQELHARIQALENA